MKNPVITITKSVYADSHKVVDCAFPQRAFIIESTENTASGYRHRQQNIYDLLESKLSLEEKEYLKDTEGKKCAFIFAAGNLTFNGFFIKADEPNTLYKHNIAANAVGNIWVSMISTKWGYTDRRSTDATACISNLKALDEATKLIKYEGFDRVLILSIEDCPNAHFLDFFGRSGASLTLATEEKFGVSPSAFDVKNYGFYLGQGGNFTLVESADIADESKVKCEVLATSIESEVVSNSSGQRPDGEGYKRAMYAVLNKSNLTPKDINLIKSHGTGTASNNMAERVAITSIFNDFIATSYKSKIGHTFGVNGLLELDLCMSDLYNEKKISKIINRTESDTRFISEDIFVKETKGMNILVNASGMGNVFSSCIVRLSK